MFLPLNCMTIGISLPQHPMAFAIQASEKLSMLSPKHTLPFLRRYCEQFSSATKRQKLSSMQYVTSWLKNLPAFWDPTSELYDANGSHLRTTVQALIDLTVQEDEVCSSLPTCINS